MTIHPGRPLPDASRDLPGRRRGNPLAGLLSQGAGVPSLFGLAPGGVYRAVARRRRRGALLPHPFTLAGGPQPRPAVCFLWHCPWGRPPAGRYPAPCFRGARTFLPRRLQRRRRPSGRLADSMVVGRRRKARPDRRERPCRRRDSPVERPRAPVFVRRWTLAKISASLHRQLPVRIGDPELDRTAVRCRPTDRKGSSVDDRPMATELEP